MFLNSVPKVTVREIFDVWTKTEETLRRDLVIVKSPVCEPHLHQKKEEEEEEFLFVQGEEISYKLLRHNAKSMVLET